MIGEKELTDAIDRIAKTEDGQLLYLYLQRRLMAVSTATDDGSLRTEHGQRLFAAHLIGLMAKGIETSGGRSESICTFAVAGPRAVSVSRGAGRRVTDDTIVPGWNDTDHTSAPASAGSGT